MKYILSTATASTKFQDHTKANDHSMLVVTRAVTVYGGSNLPSAKSGYGDMVTGDSGMPLWTPRGVVTPVSDEDAAFLAEHHAFKLGAANGFYQIMDSDPGNDHNKIKKMAAADMTAKDKSAPMTNETIDKRLKVSAGKIDEETY